MSHEILMSVENGLLRVAQIEDGALTAVQAALLKQSEDKSGNMVGQIYLARVERVVERLQAAFVDIGFDKSAFLGAREARALVPDATRDTPIEDCVEDGDTVLVQVDQVGVACHTGRRNCFFTALRDDRPAEIADVAIDPATLYDGSSAK